MSTCDTRYGLFTPGAVLHAYSLLVDFVCDGVNLRLELCHLGAQLLVLRLQRIDVHTGGRAKGHLDEAARGSGRAVSNPPAPMARKGPGCGSSLNRVGGLLRLLVQTYEDLGQRIDHTRALEVLPELLLLLLRALWAVGAAEAVSRTSRDSAGRAPRHRARRT